jgi:transmembrane sensor
MDQNDNINSSNWEHVLAILNEQEVESSVSLTGEEKILLDELRQIKKASERFDDSRFFNTESKWQELCEQIGVKRVKKPIIQTWLKYAAAAVILCMLSVGILFYLKNIRSLPISDNLALNHSIKPGGNKATLTLANGKKISLTDAQNGEVARQSGVSITKSKDGELVYASEPLTDKKHETGISYNVVETPKGGQYQINLPDGSRVWLNAGSSLRYPTSFTSLKERKVILNGEAYFEVVHNASLPFRVVTNSQEVEDIGTQFNISSYADERSIRTTLIEGAVKISDSKKTYAPKQGIVLLPGQMATNEPDKNSIAVHHVNTASIIAWKSGYFVFNDENIRDIMKDLARWYDFDIEYQGDMSNVQFHGNYLRSRNLYKLLNAIELTNKVHFKIEGRRITVIAR